MALFCTSDCPRAAHGCAGQQSSCSFYRGFLEGQKVPRPKLPTNFQMLRQLKDFRVAEYGILTECEAAHIKEVLHIAGMPDEVSLRNLRDFSVVLLSREGDDDKHDLMSAITALIDQELFERGYEV